MWQRFNTALKKRELHINKLALKLPPYKTCVYALQASFIIPFYKVLALLPLRYASGIGGWLGRYLGYRLPVSKVAFKNLQTIYPNKPIEWQRYIVQRSWDNLGRTLTEIPHLNHMEMGTDIQVEGAEILKAQNRPIIFFSAHFGNWEVLAKTANSLSLPFHRIYRKANNPFVENFIQKHRGNEAGGFIPKGKEGSKQLLRAIKNQDNIGMLLDQKMNNGIESTFMDQPVMSPNAAAILAHKHDIVLIPAYTLRTYAREPKFIVKILEPLTLGKTTEETVQQINNTLENIVNGYPEQWMWIHRRFKDVDYR